jgi:hypothetical protein
MLRDKIEDTQLVSELQSATVMEPRIVELSGFAD